jgi:hypothetical protein
MANAQARKRLTGDQILAEEGWTLGEEAEVQGWSSGAVCLFVKLSPIKPAGRLWPGTESPVENSPGC